MFLFLSVCHLHAVPPRGQMAALDSPILELQAFGSSHTSSGMSGRTSLDHPFIPTHEFLS